MGQYNVILSQKAEADIRTTIRYLKNDLQEPGTAENMFHRFKKALDSLKDMPERFPLVADNDFAEQGYRTISVGNYLVFFVVDCKKLRVDVVRVLHGRRDWRQFL